MIYPAATPQLPLWLWSSATGPTAKDGDRWTWLVIAAHTQLRLLRQAAADLRWPWEKAGRARSAHPGPGPPRVSAPPPAPRLPGPRAQTVRPGPGRPLGSKNRQPATRYDVSPARTLT